MLQTHTLIFKALKIIAWLFFIGLCIEAGGLIVNFICSQFKPEFVHNLYQKLDLSTLYNQNKWVYFGMYGFILTIAIFKALLFYKVVILVTKIELNKPFNSWAAKLITQISYYTLSIGILSAVAQQVATKLTYYNFTTEALKPFWADSKAFILMAAVIYIIAIIFSKGVAYQNELEEIV